MSEISGYDINGDILKRDLTRERLKFKTVKNPDGDVGNHSYREVSLMGV